MSKQRVLVMNGQRVLQSEEAGKWKMTMLIELAA